MIRTTLVLALVLALAPAASPARGAAAPAPAPAAPAPIPAELAPLSWFEGNWHGSQDVGGSRVAADLTYEWVLDHRFMSTRAVTRAAGATASEARGYIGLDPQTGTLTAWTFVDDGGVSLTRATSPAGADTLVFEGRPGGPAGPELRLSFIRYGADAFVLRVESRSSDAWVLAGETPFTRVRR